MAAEPSVVPVAAMAANSSSSHAISYLEWPAILGGAILASAIAVVLLTFGSAIGLSLSSPYRGEGMSMVAFAVAAGLWVLWVQVSSFLAGGYLAGRMRRRIHDSTEHEVHVRDGVHGLLVWATGVLIAAVLTFAGVSGPVSAAAQAGVVSEAVGGAVAAPDTLFRPVAGGAQAFDPESRSAALSILFWSAAAGSLSDQDRAYVSSVVERQTGISAMDADARVTQAMAEARKTLAAEKKAADTARKTGVYVAFVVAASLLVSAAAAYIAATFGGSHRDKGTVVRFFVSRWN